MTRRPALALAAVAVLVGSALAAVSLGAQAASAAGNAVPVVTVNGYTHTLDVNVGETVPLNLTATDDGQVSPLTYQWYDTANTGSTGTATFSSKTVLNPTVSFTGPGYYTLSVSAYDGQLYGWSTTIAVDVHPFVPYSRTAWLRQRISDQGLTVDPAKTAAMRSYITANDPNPAPNINGIGGKGWADAFSLAGCSDPVYKIGTGNVDRDGFLKATGFHAKATVIADLNYAIAHGQTDLPFTAIDTCGNATMPGGFVVKGTGATPAAGNTINVAGYAGAFASTSNGLRWDVPGSDGPNNWTSRGVIPASAVIRADQIAHENAVGTGPLGQKLEIFWWETDSTKGMLSPPMAGFENGQSGWGAEGQLIGVDPAFQWSAGCTPAEQDVIYTLMQYGAYIGDNAGKGGTSLKAEEDHGQWAGLGLSQQGLAADCGLRWSNFVAY